MRTEREIKAKLRYLKKRMQKGGPNFWNILTLQAYEDTLHWFRGGTFRHLEVARKKRQKAAL